MCVALLGALARTGEAQCDLESYPNGAMTGYLYEGESGRSVHAWVMADPSGGPGDPSGGDPSGCDPALDPSCDSSGVTPVAVTPRVTPVAVTPLLTLV